MTKEEKEKFKTNKLERNKSKPNYIYKPKQQMHVGELWFHSAD
jgi:hypothetical protein